MENEFGEKLDSNGYARSILHEGDCIYCRNSETVRHEVFRGKNRSNSKKYGLWITVCPLCHMMIHNNIGLSHALMADAQVKAMKHYGWETKDFIQRFGKNYV